MEKVLDGGNDMADLLQANKCRRGERWARDTPRRKASNWWFCINTFWGEVCTLLLYHMAQFFTDRGPLRIAAHVEDVQMKTHPCLQSIVYHVLLPFVLQYNGHAEDA